MLADCFLFHNEMKMLLARMEVLSPVVDKFVIVESNRTFSGKEKPYYASEFFSMKKNDRVIVHRIESDPVSYGTPKEYDPSHECWKIEHQQRSAINHACSDFSDDDFILLGDVDEIPSREAVEMMKESKFSGVATFRMAFLYYNLRVLRREVWPGTVWCPMKALRHFGAQDIRDARGGTGFDVTPGGWHLSFFGGVDSIRHKIDSFSHQEYNNPEYNDVTKIESHIREGSDLFDRDVPSDPVPDGFFPEYFLNAMPGEWV